MYTVLQPAVCHFLFPWRSLSSKKSVAAPEFTQAAQVAGPLGLHDALAGNSRRKSFLYMYQFVYGRCSRRRLLSKQAHMFLKYDRYGWISLRRC